jgi:hypothetical protein
VQQISIDRSLPPYLSSYIEKFELPYDQHTGADSNTLFFYYSGRFDTSFLVHLHKEDTTVTGVLYEILPAYHKDDDDYADRKSSLLFFEGYSFKIDASKWEYLISNARNKLLIEKNMPKRNEACADCPSYFFAHAYNTISSNSNNRAVFEAYSKFLKDSLLNQFITMRQPKLHKTSNK